MIRKHHLITIAGSAGSIDIVLSMLQQINKPLPCPLVIVLHRHRSGDDSLIDVMRAQCDFEIVESTHGQPIENHIYIAPANYHLLVEQDRSFSLSIDAPINYSRPSIDLWFSACAQVYGKELIAFLLSGANSDGTNGCQSIQDNRGYVVAQAPNSASCPMMPKSAIENKSVSCVMSDIEIIEAITSENIIKKVAKNHV